ncbi:MAG: UDP-N-acetylglucosamine 4,6-dehydratase (inverting) [Kiloniellales bacterium]
MAAAVTNASMTGGEISIDLNDREVLVTGGTGSFGQKFVATVLARFRPRRLIVLSRDEQKQFDMQHAPAFRDRSCLRFFIGDVRDAARMRMAMRDVDTVVHAAALKHIPVAEYNPFECIHTNVLGAENVVTAALDCGVERVIAISTDKAVNPINIYGASKLAADKIFVAANALVGNAPTTYSVVRYGNVLGSRGSVIPLFRRLLAEGATRLPITDERMTRFWISMAQGIDFVLSSLAMMRGGEIFVPKSASMRTIDMVRAISPGTPTHIVGIRPGEKLHEVLISEEDTSTILDFPDRYVVCPPQDARVVEHHLGRGGKPVPQGFKYASDNNPDRLDTVRLRELLDEDGA